MTNLEQFQAGYVECALWTSNDDVIDPEGHGRPLDDSFGPEDLSATARETISEDCRSFVEANAADLELYCERLGRDAGHAGHDFWLTRNRHGAGFWDRYYGDDHELLDCLRRLTNASHAYGEQDLESVDRETVEIL